VHRFAVFTAASTLFLIFVGGLVTSTGSGLAVPDWPLSYGQIFPPMVGGVFFEHGHRMVAASVGLLTVVLTFWVLAKDRRRWVGWLAACALFTVILQGVLGGITVLFLLPTAVSVAHACLAQAFFCLTVTIAVVTGRRWESAAAGGRQVDGGLRAATAGLAGVVYVQLILGAVMRHLGAGLAIPDFPLSFGRLVPPFFNAAIAIHFAHRVWALIVVAIAVMVSVRVMSRHRGASLLVRPVMLLWILVPAQVALGAMAVWTGKSVVPTTAHVACGAAILATSLVLALRSFRMTEPAAAPLRSAVATS